MAADIPNSPAHPRRRHDESTLTRDPCNGRIERLNINGDTVSVPGSASYAVYSSGQSSSVSAGSTSSGDTVEISDEGQAASLGTFTDRFRFDIDNGLLNVRRPVYARATTPGSVASATYSGRGQTRSLVSGGGLGVREAIFSLGYQDGSPRGARNGISNRQAINEFQRMASRNLPLLSMFG